MTKPKGLTKRQRLDLPQQIMREQPAEQRVHNMSEVPLGFTPLQAMQEASRCLECPKSQCVAGCPVGIDIPRFIRQVADGDFEAAVGTIRERNLLPAICGRVCPQEDQCQVVCTVTVALKSTERSVSIGKLERFVADWEREHGGFHVPELPPPTGKRVGVVGSGPAGLTVAGDLIRDGPCGHGVRGAAQAGRRAHLRHPGVPAPQGDRLPRGRIPPGAGGRVQVQLRRREDADARRSPEAGRLRRDLHRHRRRLAEVPRHPGREPLRGVLGERVPDALESHARLRFSALGHAARPQPQGRRRRRRQRRDGFGAHRAALRRRGGAHRLSAVRERDAGARRRGAPCEAGGRRLRSSHEPDAHPGRRPRLGDRIELQRMELGEPMRAAGAGRCRCPAASSSSRRTPPSSPSATIRTRSSRRRRPASAPRAGAPRGRRGNATDIDPWRLRRWRHRARRRHRHPGDGRGPACGGRDRRLPTRDQRRTQWSDPLVFGTPDSASSAKRVRLRAESGHAPGRRASLRLGRGRHGCSQPQSRRPQADRADRAGHAGCTDPPRRQSSRRCPAVLVAQVRASAIHRDVSVVKRLATALPEPIVWMFACAPGRWSTDDIAVQRHRALQGPRRLHHVPPGAGPTRTRPRLGCPPVRRQERARSALSILAERADDVLHGPREAMGPPWSKDHRMALTATIVAS